MSQCKGTTKLGAPCARLTHDESGFCSSHMVKVEAKPVKEVKKRVVKKKTITRTVKPKTTKAKTTTKKEETHFIVDERVVDLCGRKPQVVNADEYYIDDAKKIGGWLLEKSKYANPFKVGKDGFHEEVMKKYEDYILADKDLKDGLVELKKKKLCGFFHSSSVGCHGLVLIKLIDAL